MRSLCRGGLVLVAALMVLRPVAAGAVSFTVPSGATPTLQSAVAAAAASTEADNIIFIGAASISTNAETVIGADFTATHKLTIRPVPGLPFGRAFIVSTNGSQPIFRIAAAASVTIQDLDIVRYATNNESLIRIGDSSDILIQRCRIGSVWSTVGSTGWSNVVISYPIRVTLRNCMVFSRLYGNFEWGIRASYGDVSNSLYLYNNDVSDYSKYGIEVADPQVGSTLVVRNNVVVNHPAAVVEPIAFHSVVVNGVQLLTSHNTAFAALANIEDLDDAQAVSGLGGGTFRRLARVDLAASFGPTTWDASHGFDPNFNRNFYRLNPVGLMHDDANDLGVTVLNASPAVQDRMVNDDWETNHRPSGATPHTDRGADQSEIGTVDVEHAVAPRAMLWTAPRRNPSVAPEVEFGASEAGTLRFELFDLRGARVSVEERVVRAGEVGVFGASEPRAAGVYPYRVQLIRAGGPPAVALGRVVMLR